MTGIVVLARSKNENRSGRAHQGTVGAGPQRQVREPRPLSLPPRGRRHTYSPGDTKLRECTSEARRSVCRTAGTAARETRVVSASLLQKFELFVCCVLLFEVRRSTNEEAELRQGAHFCTVFVWICDATIGTVAEVVELWHVRGR